MKGNSTTRNQRKHGSRLIATLVLLPFAIIMVIPFAWMLSASLKNSVEVWAFPIQWIPKSPLFSNYAKVWMHKTYPFAQYMFNSGKVALYTVGGTLIISSMAAYAFAKINFRGRNAIFLLLLSTLMIPTHITLVPRFVLMNWFGLYNTHYALVLPALFCMLGVFMLKQFYASVPDALIESAKLDGAGHWRIWLLIVMPLSATAMISLVILSFTWSWNDYINANIFITSKSLYTIPVGLESYKDNETIAYNLIMAASASAILPVVLVYLFGQRYFIQGIATTGLKG